MLRPLVTFFFQPLERGQGSSSEEPWQLSAIKVQQMQVLECRVQVREDLSFCAIEHHVPELPGPGKGRYIKPSIGRCDFLRVKTVSILFGRPGE
jgi:hypothetical protein